jgi:hypothetical protein
MSVRDMQTRGANRGDVVVRIALGVCALLGFCLAYGQAPADASPEEGNLLGVILFFIIFVGTIVGGAAYYWWRAKEKHPGKDEEKID